MLQTFITSMTESTELLNDERWLVSSDRSHVLQVYRCIFRQFSRLYTPHTLSACLLLFKVAKLELETRVREHPNPKPRFGNTSCIRSRQPGPDRHRVSGPGSRDSIWGLPVPAAITKYQYPSLPSPSHTHHKRFSALFPGPSGWAGARRELLDFMVQGNNRRRHRHTDHPTGHHSIRTNQCLHLHSIPGFRDYSGFRD